MIKPVKETCNDTYHCVCGHVVRKGQLRCMGCGEALEWKPVVNHDDSYVSYLMNKYCFGGEAR